MRNNLRLCEGHKPRRSPQFCLACDDCDGWAPDPEYKHGNSGEIRYKGGWIRQGLIMVPTHTNGERR